ncbi:BglG family transcription antiterminator [Shimazuella kribbensis]|uniref:BglG family transcription antiterminator n=1 Tax=Shimazuella kribbensis TaxID=139808 RepID=UPI0004264A3E|nr:BglG family transcription antiterminator [Shimazuella kribbensis]
MSLLNAREKKLLSILHKKNQWMRSSELASHLSVTPRTIGNDIRKINQLQKKTVIASSNQGYKLLDHDFVTKQIYHDNSKIIPHTQNERIFYLLRKMMTQNHIHIYDLSEEIYVSTSTIEKDLKKVQSLLDQISDITIIKKGDNIYIQGYEKEKRALVSEILFQETKNSFFNLQNYQPYFPHYELEFISEVVLSITSKYDVLINDLSLVNLVVHIAITLDRVQDANLIKDTDLIISQEMPEYKCALDIGKELSLRYNIQIPEKEIIYLGYLIIGKKISNRSTHTSTPLNNALNTKYTPIIQRLLQKLESAFGVHLHDDELNLNLALHTKTAVERVQNGLLIKNPLLTELKSNYPFIFEIAIFITNELYKNIGYAFSEDEIGYFALHVGTTYEKINQQKRNSLQVAIIHSKYFKEITDFIHKMEELYHLSINPIHVSTLYDQRKLNSLEVDLILSTLPMDIELNIPIVQISPFFNQNDQAKFAKFMTEFHKQKQLQLLKTYIDQYFHEDLFYKNLLFEDRFELIQYIGNELIQRNFVSKSYVDSILKRENISPTSFASHFAIPHAMQMSANKTAIGTMILEKPIKWGDYAVHVVIVIVIKQEERKDFMLLYENLIPILTDRQKIAELTKAKDFQHFKTILLQEYVANP